MQRTGVRPFQIVVDGAIYVEGMHNTVFFSYCDKLSFLSDAWESKLFMTNDHTRYCELLSGSHV